MRKMLSTAFRNGKSFPSSIVQIPIRGNGVFTTVKVLHQIPLFFTQHYNRLLEFCQSMRIACPPKERLYAWINQLILANNVENCAVRISILVNGTVLLHATTQPKSGKVVSVISVKDTRKVRTKKIINRQVNLRAVEKAKKHFADDAIFVQKEVLIESTKANLFSMSKEGKLISPSIQGRGLDGVMRTIIKENAFFLEKEISLTTEGPLVLVNCLQIQKVKRLDDRKLINPDKLFFQIKEIVKKAENDYVRFYHE